MTKRFGVFSLVVAMALFVTSCGPGEGEDAGDDGQDAGPTCPAAGGACGTIDDNGGCYDGLLKYCDNNVLQCYDCPRLGTHCADYGGTVGFDCLLGLGQTCDPVYPNQGYTGYGCDPHQGLTCRQSGSGYTCQL